MLVNILKQKTGDPEVKKYAVAYMERKGSFEYSARCIKELREKAMQLVEETERTAGELGGKEGAEGVRAILEKMKVE